MSAIGAYGASSDYGQILQLLDNSASVRQQLQKAQQQTATGRVSETYAGLGAGARVSLDLGPQIAHQQTWQRNIDVAAGRLNSSQTALQAIADIASTAFAKTNTLNNLSETDVASIKNLATQGLQQVADLLNTKVGDVYIFAGQDTSNPPVPDTSPAVTAPALLASDTATPPFSATIGTSAPTVEVGEGERVSVGVLANKNTFAVSAAPTSGSFARDILHALATLTTATSGSTLLATAADARARLNSAISAIATEQGALGTVQASLQARKDQSAQTVITLSSQVSDVQDVDLAATLTRTSNLQTQLQASYQIIASLKNLSLAQFI